MHSLVVLAYVLIHNRITSETTHAFAMDTIARLTGLGISSSLYSKNMTTSTYTSDVILT